MFYLIVKDIMDILIKYGCVVWGYLGFRGIGIDSIGKDVSDNFMFVVGMCIIELDLFGLVW